MRLGWVQATFKEPVDLDNPDMIEAAIKSLISEIKDEDYAALTELRFDEVIDIVEDDKVHEEDLEWWGAYLDCEDESFFNLSLENKIKIKVGNLVRVRPSIDDPYEQGIEVGDTGRIKTIYLDKRPAPITVQFKSGKEDAFWPEELEYLGECF